MISSISLKAFLNTLPGREPSLNQHDWVIGQLQSLRQGSSLLDVGAGCQPYRPYTSHLKYVTQDFCQYSPLASFGDQSESWDYGSSIDIISDITSIPCRDQSFDAILCTEVLEHVFAPIEAITEMLRLLKPGGLLIITVPFRSLYHMYPHYYYSGFSSCFFSTFIEKNSFPLESLSIQPNGTYADNIAQDLRRLIVYLQCKQVFGLLRYFLIAVTYLVIVILKYIPSSALGESTNGYFVTISKPS
ncbi:class I SAM-dependent methyltransferase [Synechococcus sp. NB0720_010]|uniref:class I SAM-dependent methyltransferase n=1 Tax=Synechococcus sp. NB0720_010 TaxID=2907159 RepID=UPI001FF897E5|nr:class I SAM-dependent methyltransferase [Synechococcus sp. NB0720_010]UPH89130.1 class I SAM-dependent methyltransferase [Synechococcus sp. NB0720_010]